MPQKPKKYSRRKMTRSVQSPQKGHISTMAQTQNKMANGEKLDDNRLTIAFYNLGIISLNSRVSIVNRSNGKSIVATVTDTGGFMDCCNRIADLSLATANAIGAETDKS